MTDQTAEQQGNLLDKLAAPSGTETAGAAAAGGGIRQVLPVLAASLGFSAVAAVAGGMMGSRGVETGLASVRQETAALQQQIGQVQERLQAVSALEAQIQQIQQQLQSTQAVNPKQIAQIQQQVQALSALQPAVQEIQRQVQHLKAPASVSGAAAPAPAPTVKPSTVKPLTVKPVQQKPR